MTKTNTRPHVLGAFGTDAIGNIENIVGPGQSAMAQAAARQHILVQEAAKALTLGIGAAAPGWNDYEMSFDFANLAN